ncbi:hypothetical protein V8E55_008768 [Tylopilus felleus]
MQSTVKRQKFPKRRGRQHVSPPPTTQSLSPLEAFFANYSPRFRYDATVSASREFCRLCKKFGWGKQDPPRKKAYQNFKDALVQQFNGFYGTDVNDLKSWQNLCYIVHIDPIPEDLHACREASRPVLLGPVSLAQFSLPDAVYHTFVNLVDLVDTKTSGVKVKVFDSEVELSRYTKSKRGKFFPRDNAYAGGLLRYLLRHINHPRDGYDSSRRRRGGGKRRRR